jgi:F-type H+-transporting ATPase subunit gamma
MASLKDIKRHIVAVKQTQKLTKAMNMVAAAKLRATQNRTERFRGYADEHARLIGEVARRAPAAAGPMLTEGRGPGKVLILAVSSDRGLCGSFNANIFNRLDAFIVSLREQGLEPDLYLVGRKARDYYARRRVGVFASQVGWTGEFSYDLAQLIAGKLIKAFQDVLYREVWLIYTSFETLNRHVVTLRRFLPLTSDELQAGRPGSSSAGLPQGSDYLIEPAPAELLGRLIPRSLTILVYRALLESFTSENAARMQAMDNASKSCKDIITNLTMAFNKARQAAVTNELLDIVNGAEALKG